VDGTDLVPKGGEKCREDSQTDEAGSITQESPESGNTAPCANHRATLGRYGKRDSAIARRSLVGCGMLLQLVATALRSSAGRR